MSGRDASLSNVELSLVLPAFNEQEVISRAIREADAALAGLGIAYEIIVINDGSTDRTREVVLGHLDEVPHLRLLDHAGNRGYGAALRTGFSAACYRLIAFTDADCQFDLSELAELIPLAATHDIVCGYRARRRDPAYRRLLAWGYNRFVCLMFGMRMSDCDCALKLFRRAAWHRVVPASDNFFVNAEILWRAHRAGLRVAERPVSHRQRMLGQSKVSLAEIPRTFRTLLPFWWKHVLLKEAG